MTLIKIPYLVTQFLRKTFIVKYMQIEYCVIIASVDQIFIRTLTIDRLYIIIFIYMLNIEKLDILISISMLTIYRLFVSYLTTLTTYSKPASVSYI